MPHFQGLIFRGELLNVQGWFSYLESFDILMALVWKVPDLLGRFKTTPKNRGWMSQDPGRCIYIQYICVFFVSYIYICVFHIIFIFIYYIYIYHLFDIIYLIWNVHFNDSEDTQTFIMLFQTAFFIPTDQVWSRHVPPCCHCKLRRSCWWFRNCWSSFYAKYQIYLWQVVYISQLLCWISETSTVCRKLAKNHVPSAW